MANDPAENPVQAPDINKVVHEPARLVILSQLYVVSEADFLFIKRQTGLTQGNLSSHLTKLESAGYMEMEKKFVGKRPRTVLRLTVSGRRAIDEYTANMQHLLNGINHNKGE